MRIVRELSPEISPGDLGGAWMVARLRTYDPDMRGAVEFPPAESA